MFRSLKALTVVLLLVLACSKSGDGSATVVPLDDFSDGLTAAECEMWVRCHAFSDLALCRQAYRIGLLGAGVFTPGALTGFNPAPLVARLEFNSVSAIVAAARAGKARYDGTAARTCFDAVRDLSCAEIPHTPEVLALACQDVFTGTLSDGAHCVSDLECGTHSFCAASILGTSCEGTCTSAGPLCNVNRQCPEGYACDRTVSMATDTSHGICVPPVPAGASGEPCGTSSRCQVGLYCDLDSICRPSPVAGESCASGNPFYACALGLVCVRSFDELSSTCMEPAAKGESCQGQEQCGGRFSSLICDNITRRCVEWSTTGFCVDRPCPYTAYCASHICAPVHPLGAVCSVNSDECGYQGVACLAADSQSGTGICTSQLPATCAP